MNLIPMKYQATNGEQNDGTVEISCKLCGTKFWVPVSEAADITEDGPVCEECASAMEKMNTEAKEVGDKITEISTQI